MFSLFRHLCAVFFHFNEILISLSFVLQRSRLRPKTSLLLFLYFRKARRFPLNGLPLKIVVRTALPIDREGCSQRYVRVIAVAIQVSRDERESFVWRSQFEEEMPP